MSTEQKVEGSWHASFNNTSHILNPFFLVKQQSIASLTQALIKMGKKREWEWGGEFQFFSFLLSFPFFI